MEDELILDMTKTYIYEGEEYILTGRTAEKSPDAVSPPIRRRSKRPILVSGPEKEIMVEITPAPKNSGSRAVGVTIDSRWVKFADLFIIRDQLDENYEEDA